MIIGVFELDSWLNLPNPAHVSVDPRFILLPNSFAKQLSSEPSS